MQSGVQEIELTGGAYPRVTRKVADVKPFSGNARTHSEAQIARIAASITRFGFTSPLLIDEKNRILAGHGRREAALQLGLKDVPCIVIAGLSEGQYRTLILSDNRIAENASWDDNILRAEITAILAAGGSTEVLGFDDDEIAALMAFADKSEALLAVAQEPFDIPCTPLLNARAGAWSKRKKAWIAAGIDSGSGRTDDLTYQTGDHFVGVVIADMGSTSIYDPVLCEAVYRWYAPVGGRILDPFAGGSVRGVVAQVLGFAYVGFDIRPEQVAANQAQAPQTINPVPKWIAADSTMLENFVEPESVDFVHSCPPYADLEAYSDNPADISTMAYAQFLPAYREIIAACVRVLKPGGRAVFTVGDMRDPAGVYRNFVQHTVDAFVDAGMQHEDEHILVTSAGSLPLRAGRPFQAARKLGKTHQNVLVFRK